MRVLDLRRHAIRQKGQDSLSPEGRVQAESVGRTLPTDYAFVFVSPANRAAETVAWFFRASGQPLPPHAVVPGLQSEVEDRWRQAAAAAPSSRIDAIMTVDAELVATESRRLARTVAEMMGRVPNGGRALAVGHSPLIEAAVYGLLEKIIEPLRECEGIRLGLDETGSYRVEELPNPTT